MASDRNAKKDPAEAAHKKHVVAREEKDKANVEKHEAKAA